MLLLELPCLPDWYLHLYPIEIITQDPALNPCQCQMRCTVGNCLPPYSPSAVASTWHLSPAELLLLECLTLDIKGAAPSPSLVWSAGQGPRDTTGGNIPASHWNDSNIGLGVRTSDWCSCVKYSWWGPCGCGVKTEKCYFTSLHSSPLKCCVCLWQKAGCRSPADVSLWG